MHWCLFRKWHKQHGQILEVKLLFSETYHRNAFYLFETFEILSSFDECELVYEVIDRVGDWSSGRPPCTWRRNQINHVSFQNYCRCSAKQMAGHARSAENKRRVASDEPKGRAAFAVMRPKESSYAVRCRTPCVATEL